MLIILIICMLYMVKSFKLILVRHGISKWNAQNVYTGWYNIGLTDKGIEKSSYLGSYLNQMGYHPEIIYTSKQIRAIHTSKVIREKLPNKNIPIISNWRLNERHYGMLTGLDKNKYPFASTYYEMPPKIKRGFNDPILKMIPSYSANEYLNNIKYGESLYDVHKRLMPYFYNTILPFNKDMLIVSHKNTLKTLVKHIEQISDEDDETIDIDNSSPIIYDVCYISGELQIYRIK